MIETVRRKMALTYGYYLDDAPIGDVVIELPRLRDLAASEQALAASASRSTPYWSTEIGNRLHRDNCVALEPLQTRLLPLYWIARATEDLRRHYWPAFGQAARMKHAQIVQKLKESELEFSQSCSSRKRDPRVIDTALALIAGLQGEYRCHYCNRLGPNHLQDPDGNPWHGDHFVALHNGGLDEIRNIVRACRECNLAKSTKDALEFCQSRRYDPPSPPPLLSLA